MNDKLLRLLFDQGLGLDLSVRWNQKPQTNTSLTNVRGLTSPHIILRANQMTVVSISLRSF